MSVAAADSKTSYLLDKLQSLSGVIPIGAFLAEHFWSNSYALVSVGKYNDVSRELQQIPWRIIVETCVCSFRFCFTGFTVVTSGGRGSPTPSGILGWRIGCTCCSAGRGLSLSFSSAGICTPSGFWGMAALLTPPCSAT